MKKKKQHDLFNWTLQSCLCWNNSWNKRIAIFDKNRNGFTLGIDEALCGLLMDLWNKLSINKIVNCPLNKFKWIKDHLERTGALKLGTTICQCWNNLKKKGTMKWHRWDDKIMNFVTSRKMIRITKFKTNNFLVDDPIDLKMISLQNLGFFADAI
jgi:hypothetical protein